MISCLKEINAPKICKPLLIQAQEHLRTLKFQDFIKAKSFKR
jgi:hypothetical protein